MKILLVYPRFPDTFWSFKHALDFIKKKAANPPLGLITIAAMLPDSWPLRLVDMNVTSLMEEDIAWADAVFISAMNIQRRSVLEVIDRCNQSVKMVVAGGPLFTSEYQKFVGVDHFVLNEAEITLPLFLQDLERGCPAPVYRTDGFADLMQTPVPRFDLLDLKRYDSMSIQFTRGCPFNCDFCNVTALLGHRVRTKTANQIIAELDALYKMGWRRSIFFVDDNFIGNKKILKKEILPALIEWRKGKKAGTFITEASINLADDLELMKLMVKAGFKSVFVGIETPNEESLIECQKFQNKGRNLIASVRKLQNYGLQVMGGFIVGFDSDTPSIFQAQIDFIQKSGIVTAMVGLLQAPSGTDLYRRLKRENRLVEEMSGDNVDGTTNIIPKMDLGDLKNGYRQMMMKIYSPTFFYERIRNCLREYNPGTIPSHFEWVEVAAFLKSIYLLGIKGIERWHYWRLIMWTLLNFPRKIQLAVTFAIYGYHFRKVSESVQGG
jgi:radical SAM superfamily enzyme YgiQ (UPF0313 family)